MRGAEFGLEFKPSSRTRPALLGLHQFMPRGASRDAWSYIVLALRLRSPSKGSRTPASQCRPARHSSRTFASSTRTPEAERFDPVDLEGGFGFGIRLCVLRKSRECALRCRNSGGVQQCGRPGSISDRVSSRRECAGASALASPGSHEQEPTQGRDPQTSRTAPMSGASPAPEERMVWEHNKASRPMVRMVEPAVRPSRRAARRSRGGRRVDGRWSGVAWHPAGGVAVTPVCRRHAPREPRRFGGTLASPRASSTRWSESRVGIALLLIGVSVVFLARVGPPRALLSFLAGATEEETRVSGSRRRSRPVALRHGSFAARRMTCSLGARRRALSR